MIKRDRSRATDPFLAKGWVPQHMPEHRPALVENLLPMRHEEQTGPGQRGAKPAVVDGRHHRLAGTGRRHQKVPMLPTHPGERDELQQAFLEWLEPHFERTEDDEVSTTRSAIPVKRLQELRLQVRDEVA